MIFSAYILYIRFKKSIDPRRQNWPFHSSNSNNFATSHSTHSTFQGLRAFHSLRCTSFASLHFIRFALLHSFRFALLHFIHFASFRQALPDSTRFAHSVRFASLHLFRFAPLIPFHSTHSVSLHSFHLLHPFRCHSFHLWSFFIVSVWLVPLKLYV